ncbi:hypothetical protein [Microbulbifer marinus]|uniref:DUF4239 domain-containing protein n=1 Tax=Microbulbifer marinus TaxID=658218 RepID=A0A1H3YSJ3_9GAMM|nr:hypothetical protein [Microbulbifer marinus]SEA14525.1 hypothetical protein SAMN05216562_1959 [Microbulbifer marinus]
MNLSDFFHTLPLLIIYVWSVLLVLCSLGAGVWLGRRYLRSHREVKDSSVGSAIAATLGLLAFLLAFTFNMTADRYNTRKAVLLDEVNAIHTVYLRASFLDDADKLRARQLLIKYVELRNFDLSDKIGPAELRQFEAIHENLWRLVDSYIDRKYDAGYLRQFVEPLNTMINFHHSRAVMGLEYRIPGPIWLALYFMTTLAMVAIGFQFGISRGGSPQVAVALALTFATVIILIADLDRSAEGTLMVDQRPMAELNQRLQKMQAQRPGG